MSWALTHGTENLDVQREVIYFQMARIFGFRPWEVDQIDFDAVLGMLSMESAVRTKETNEIKDGRRKIRD